MKKSYFYPAPLLHFMVFTLVALLLMSCQSQTEVGQANEKQIEKATPQHSGFVLAGHAPAQANKKIKILAKPNPLVQQETAIPIQVDADGYFISKININTPLAASIHFGQASGTANFYMQPGDSLYLQVNNSITYTGSKQAAQYSTLLSKLNTNLKSEGLVKVANDRNHIRKLNPKQYRSFIDSLYQVNHNYTTQLINQADNIAPDFKAYLYAKSAYQYAQILLDYPSQYERYNRNKPKPVFNETYYAFLNDIDLNSPYNTVQALPEYLQFADTYVAHMVKKEYVDSNPKTYDAALYYPQRYEMAEKHLQGNIKFLVQLKALYEGASRTKAECLVPLLAEYQTQCAIPELKTMAATLQNKLQPYAAGNPMPTLELMNEAGQTVTLDANTYKGKVVYIDFWASWCGPCKKEMPHAKTLKTNFSNAELQDIVWLYVSMDRNTDAWYKYLKNNHIKGEHLYAPKAAKASVNNAYNISGIPKFVLIDKAGNIADSYAKRPSAAGLEEDIRALLKP